MKDFKHLSGSWQFHVGAKSGLPLPCFPAAPSLTLQSLTLKTAPHRHCSSSCSGSPPPSSPVGRPLPQRLSKAPSPSRRSSGCPLLRQAGAMQRSTWPSWLDFAMANAIWHVGSHRPYLGSKLSRPSPQAHKQDHVSFCSSRFFRLPALGGASSRPLTKTRSI